MFTLTLSCYFESPGGSWLHINVVINWQLSKQGIRWPVSPDRIAGSGVDPSGRVFFEVIRWQFIRFQMIAGSRLLFFKNSYQLCCVYVSIALHYQTDLRRKTFSQFFLKYRPGRPFLTMVTCWSRSTSNFYALIGYNLTGEFMRKIYAASWKLFTWTAEAERVLSQLLMFLIVFFRWMYKMKYSCYQECSLIHGWFVYWVFRWEMRRLSKPIIRFRMASFLYFTLLGMCARIIKAQAILTLLDSFQELHLEIW